MDEGYNPSRNHVEDVLKSPSKTIDDLEEAFRNRPAHGWTNKPAAAGPSHVESRPRHDPHRCEVTRGPLSKK